MSCLQIRDVGLGVFLFFVSGSSIICLKTFPMWWEVFGLSGALTIYSVSSFVGAAYVLLFVTEMKGKSIDNIPLQPRK